MRNELILQLNITAAMQLEKRNKKPRCC